MGPGASRKPSVPPPCPPSGALRSPGTREPRPPPAAGARAPPSPRPVPKLGKLFNPFWAASVPWTQPLGRGSGGGLGAAAPWEVSGRFRNGGSGQQGPFGSCQGVLLSQNRTVLQQTLLLARFPPSAPDFLIHPGAIGWAEEGDRERCGRVLGKGDPAGIPAGGGKDFPLPHRSASFDFWPLLPGSGRPGKAHQSPRPLRAPDSSAPADSPGRVGAGRAGLCS